MLNKIKFTDVKLTGGFLREKQELVRKTTVYAVYNRFKETGRFEALKCRYKDGKGVKPHYFWDSDVAKWIEGVSYLLTGEDIPELRAVIEEAIDDIEANCDEDGYFNSYFLTVEKGNKFTKRDYHELYCAGHLIEAAIAYGDATGDDRFLKIMCRFADHIEKVFKIDGSANFVTPGHPELEMALAKLYEKTHEEKYKELLKFFIEEHGRNDKDTKEGNLFLNGAFNIFYNQDDMPLKDRKTAEGHSVRCLYLLSGMADYSRLCGDREMFEACRRVFDNIVSRRMYVTGGVGSTNNGETFTIDYDLPSRLAYAETCAAISLVMFTERMQNMEVNSLYGDIAERALYNGVMSGMSVDGKSFFYVNPLEIVPKFNNPDTSSNSKRYFPMTRRKEVFNCSCCPPNITRFILSIANIMYSCDENTLYIHHYADSETVSKNTSVIQKTNYPCDGKVTIEYKTDKEYIAIRVPGWCKGFTLSEDYSLESGYARIKASKSGTINAEFEMKPVFIYPNANIYELAGKVCVMRGPVVYCAEGCDNEGDLFSAELDTEAEIEMGDDKFIIPSLRVGAYVSCPGKDLYPDSISYKKTTLSMIPYYAFANRGESEMRVWFNKK